MTNSPRPYYRPNVAILTLNLSPWITIARTTPIQLLQPLFVFAQSSRLSSETRVACHMTAGRPPKL